jgi:hypothetical protein
MQTAFDVTRLRYICGMPDSAKDTQLDEALLSVWRQALVDRAKRIRLGDDVYPVRSTAKSKLAQVDFDFAGQSVRGLEQNPATASRWAHLARKGGKVMQFLIGGRYIAAVADGKITHFARRKT